MDEPPKIQYPYAFDEDRRLVCIKDVSKDSRYEHTFSCPSCSGKMIPCLGDKNTHYFMHENKKCGKETYVHQTAKQIICDKFNSGELILKMYVEGICKTPCEYQKEDCCKAKIRKEYNLAEHYDKIYVEKDIIKDEEIFRPDVTLSSSKGVLKPICIEICNTSPCSKKKMEHCENIIEIKVKEYEDLVSLKNNPIEELPVDYLNRRNKGKVGCYNFKSIKVNPEELKSIYPYCQLSAQEKRLMSPYWRLWWYQSGKCFISQILDGELNIHKNNTAFEITAKASRNCDSIQYHLKEIAIEHHPELLECDYCKHEVNFESYSGLNTWCDLGKNGSSRKNTFDSLKARHCIYYEKRNIEDFGPFEKPEIIQYWEPEQ